jgi:hypothetical protein
MNLRFFLPFAALLALFALLAIVSLYEWIYRFSERTANDVIPFLRNINLEELRNLFDASTERYLQMNLTPREFKKSQWKRCRLALQYVGDLAHNAKVFQEWGKYERTRSRKTLDRNSRRTGLELTIACAQCRICAVLVRLKLRSWLLRMAVLPFVPAPTFASLPRLGSVEMVGFYEQIKTAAVALGEAYGQSYHDRLSHAL